MGPLLEVEGAEVADKSNGPLELNAENAQKCELQPVERSRALEPEASLRKYTRTNSVARGSPRVHVRRCRLATTGCRWVGKASAVVAEAAREERCGFSPPERTCGQLLLPSELYQTLLPPQAAAAET
ncbi:hypothetical protein CYMTET_33354 [Cymbomonas tetramitiformis]|uniref:Uncharacterized protein n=1 Tax=Cymbomonas tetramitiformis TaxID=36881 RepID=A0AAE0FDB6_9CHLO|nr:hypothetical protein CYMTET_33354 [Cymbomonas tetramitiformis]